MIYDGICPKPGCGGQLVEAIGFRVPGGKFNVNHRGYLVKTKCINCGAFIGYRPVRLGHAQDAKSKAKPGRSKRSNGPVPAVQEDPGVPRDQRDLLV
jgi:hypothetical protein